MDFDPLARDLPPPRYQVESGSEDESNDRTAKLPVGDVLLDLDRDVTESRDVVVLVAGAGRAWLERDAAQVPPEDGTVQFEREQVSRTTCLQQSGPDGPLLTRALCRSMSFSKRAFIFHKRRTILS